VLLVRRPVASVATKRIEADIVPCLFHQAQAHRLSTDVDGAEDPSARALSEGIRDEVAAIEEPPPRRPDTSSGRLERIGDLRIGGLVEIEADVVGETATGSSRAFWPSSSSPGALGRLRRTIAP